MPWSAHQGIPPAGVYAGNDQDGSPIYIGRAFHEGDQLPAKVIPSKQAAYVSHNGVEIYKSNFEVSSLITALQKKNPRHLLINVVSLIKVCLPVSMLQSS